MLTTGIERTTAQVDVTHREGERVRHIVQRTKAVRWWIGRQIEHGKTDEQIVAELPAAVAFITGRIGLKELDECARRARSAPSARSRT